MHLLFFTDFTEGQNSGQFINPLLWKVLLSISDFNLFVDTECSFSYGRVLLFLPYFLHGHFIIEFKTRKKKKKTPKQQTNLLCTSSQLNR